ncbi:metal ABC transporter permease [Candidatus Giovannonibacteria bacterium]|nr:metal ABC transporter permease [Candidatus Giovannonibacteria bacterium]
MSELTLGQTLVAGAFIAAAGGLLGSFALLRRMALVGDALSHVALPGIALGLLFNFNILLGSLVFLIAGTFLIWLTEHKTKLPVDTVVGVFFSLSLAVGALLTPEEEILDALFGDILSLTIFDFWWAVTLSAVIIFFLLFFSKRLTLTLISTDLSRSVGFSPHRLELFFLLIFALAVAVGIKFVGALLMGSLIIIPAATSRNLAPSMKSYFLSSGAIAIFGSLLGIYLSDLYKFPPGPVFVIIMGGFFLISIIFKRSSS